MLMCHMHDLAWTSCNRISFMQILVLTWKKMPLEIAFGPYDPYQAPCHVATCDLLPTLLPLLRLMLLRADSLASRMGCWWSCSLWICSLMLRASWMAFITASWSPNNAVELRLDRMSERKSRLGEFCDLVNHEHNLFVRSLTAGVLFLKKPPHLIDVRVNGEFASQTM